MAVNYPIELYTEGESQFHDDQIVIQNKYLSSDFGAPMVIGEVTRTRSSLFAVGDCILGALPELTVPYTMTLPCGRSSLMPHLIRIPRDKQPELPMTYSLSVLGVHGQMAYFANKIFGFKKGETFYIADVNSPMAHLLAQFAQRAGCRVVGSLKSFDGRVAVHTEMSTRKWFDSIFTNRDPEVCKQNIAQRCPQGIDHFFDNGDGEMLDVVLEHMNQGGRICLAESRTGGLSRAIKHYNLTILVEKQILMEGMDSEMKSMRRKYGHNEAIIGLSKMVMSGELVHQEEFIDVCCGDSFQEHAGQDTSGKIFRCIPPPSVAVENSLPVEASTMISIY